MDKKESLTNESVRKKFKSQFELVNYAIKLAESMIQSGRAPRVNIDNENTAVVIIEEIQQGKDFLEEIIPVDSNPIQEPTFGPNGNESASAPASKPAEKKKARRILA